MMVPWHLQPKFSGRKHVPDDCDSRGSVQQDGCGKIVSRNPPTDTHTPRADLKDQGYVTYHRYYHVFKKGELRELFEEFSHAVVVEREFYDHENWCVLAVKL